MRWYGRRIASTAFLSSATDYRWLDAGTWLVAFDTWQFKAADTRR
jgi:hypothetical protein